MSQINILNYNRLILNMISIFLFTSEIEVKDLKYSDLFSNKRYVINDYLSYLKNKQ